MGLTKLQKVERETARRIAKEKHEARLAEVNAVIAANKCPQCGAGIRRNLALTGWHQCEQFGAEGFRKDSSKPACGWQGFNN